MLIAIEVGVIELLSRIKQRPPKAVAAEMKFLKQRNLFRRLFLDFFQGLQVVV